MEWQSVAELLNRVLRLLEEAVAEYKRRERQKNIDKIKEKPNEEWSKKFGGK